MQRGSRIDHSLFVLTQKIIGHQMKLEASRIKINRRFFTNFIIHWGCVTPCYTMLSAKICMRSRRPYTFMKQRNWLRTANSIWSRKSWRQKWMESIRVFLYYEQHIASTQHYLGLFCYFTLSYTSSWMLSKTTTGLDALVARHFTFWS